MGPGLVYYVSGHGFGHAVRSGLVIEELLRLLPGLRILVRSDRPQWLFPPGVTTHGMRVDVGMIQLDSLTLRVDETVREALAFEHERVGLAELEAERVAEYAPAVIVSDIPPLAFDVAAHLRIPSIAVGNFSWDWIYGNCGASPRLTSGLVASIRTSEQRATALLRLPLHGEMSAFRRIEDVPIIAKRSTSDPTLVRCRYGIPLGTPAILLSFVELLRLDLEPLGRLRQYTFVVTTDSRGAWPENVVLAPPDPATYHDLLAACDVVVMKPGYGTVVDCLVNRIPMVYARRPGFAEEQVLVDAMHTWGRAIELDQAALFAGDLAPAIEAARALRTPWHDLRSDGALVVARRIFEIAGFSGG